MLTTITDRREITRLQSLFELRVKVEAGRSLPCKLGWQGEQRQAAVYWLAEHGIWVCFDQDHNRHWTPLGTTEPVVGRSLDITCEINVPFEGVNRKIGGVFARAPVGSTYLLHRGGVGGGRKGIGKRQFLSSYSGAYAELDTADEPIPLVADLLDPGFLRHVAAFVRSVERFKRSHRGVRLARPLDDVSRIAGSGPSVAFRLALGSSTMVTEAYTRWHDLSVTWLSHSVLTAPT